MNEECLRYPNLLSNEDSISQLMFVMKERQTETENWRKMNKYDKEMDGDTE